MEISEWIWKSCNGLDMYARGWVPKGEPRAAIMLVHGHGEHVVRYDHVASALTEKGYAMLGFDLCGHGKSGGPRGHIPSYDALMDDISDFFKQIEERYPGLPRFLYGHSLGGNLVTELCSAPQTRFAWSDCHRSLAETGFRPACFAGKARQADERNCPRLYPAQQVEYQGAFP